VNGIELDEYDPGIRERLLKRFRTSSPLPITPLESLELALLEAVREIERLREQCFNAGHGISCFPTAMVTLDKGGT